MATKVSEETELLQAILADSQTIPRHVGIVLDGNRRWARQHRVPLVVGHKKGTDKVEQISHWAVVAGIKVVSFYGWSTENFKRDGRQVGYMMKLFEEQLNRAAKMGFVHSNKIRMKVIGRIDLLPPRVQKAIVNLEKATAGYNKMQANICLAYGGRQEIVDACREISARVAAGDLAVDQIDENMIKANSYLTGEDPDLIIRTGGERRISNFLLWHIAYSEFYFEPKLLPDLEQKDFYRIIKDYQERQRRFGK